MKAYIKYCRPFKSEDDEPPIEEMWIEGDRPKKRLADGCMLYCYDCEGESLVNERIWDGFE